MRVEAGRCCFRCFAMNVRKAPCTVQCQCWCETGYEGMSIPEDALDTTGPRYGFVGRDVFHVEFAHRSGRFCNDDDEYDNTDPMVARVTVGYQTPQERVIEISDPVQVRHLMRLSAPPYSSVWERAQ